MRENMKRTAESGTLRKLSTSNRSNHSKPVRIFGGRGEKVPGMDRREVCHDYAVRLCTFNIPIEYTVESIDLRRE